MNPTVSGLPNLLIIGAPRCGTTSLHDWLVAHPDIEGSRQKETFYLMDRASHEFVDKRNIHDHGLEGYARLFAHCAGADVRLESTAGYLYQATALEVLPGLPGDPRMIVVLREPAGRVLSTFRYFKGHKAQLPRDMTFGQFVEAVDRADPVVTANEFIGDAIEHGRYASYLARWREAVGSDRIRVLLLEDLRRNAANVVPSIADWCGVDGGFYTSYDWPHRNESYEVRFPGPHRWVLRRLLPLVTNERIKRGLRGIYIALNGRRSGPTPDDERQVLAELRTRFQGDNRRLASEWGLDLSAWTS